MMPVRMWYRHWKKWKNLNPNPNLGILDRDLEEDWPLDLYYCGETFQVKGRDRADI